LKEIQSEERVVMLVYVIVWWALDVSMFVCRYLC